MTPAEKTEYARIQVTKLEKEIAERQRERDYWLSVFKRDTERKEDDKIENFLNSQEMQDLLEINNGSDTNRLDKEKDNIHIGYVKDKEINNKLMMQVEEREETKPIVMPKKKAGNKPKNLINLKKQEKEVN